MLFLHLKMNFLGDNPKKKGVYRWGVKHCCSLVMYRFCSNKALYSAILSFVMFVFRLTPFSLALLVKLLLTKKYAKLFCSLLSRNK